MRRRQFITLLGGAAAWPLSARAQQSAMPVIGFVSGQSPQESTHSGAAFRKALNDTGYVEGKNVTVEYHWLDGQYDRAPALMADLVHRRVAVIATPGFAAGAHAAKAATTTIPIVFGVAQDPVKLGLVASLARPGGNATGINLLSAEVLAKRLGLLHDLVPKAARIAVLINPANSSTADATLGEIPEAARTLGLQIQVLHASTNREIEAAFAKLVSDRADALFVAPDAFFTSRRVQFATLAASSGDSCRLFQSNLSGGGWANELRRRYSGILSTGWRLYRPNPQGREARRFAGVTVNQMGVRHQYADG